MGLTISEKILLERTTEKHIHSGQIITVKIDILMGNDISSPGAISEFKKIGMERVFDPQKIFLIPDHLVPSRDILSAENYKLMKAFAKEYGIQNFFEAGRAGIEHVFLPEIGAVMPGQLIIGGDSHTCTYGALGALGLGMGSTDLAYCMAFGETWVKVPQTIKFVLTGKPGRWIGGKDLILYVIGQIGVEGANYSVMEFDGSVFDFLGMNDRFTICNMAVEAGAKTAIIEPDKKTMEAVSAFSGGGGKIYHSDPDADYSDIHEFEVSGLRPQVACPHSPGNVRIVDELSDVHIDQVVIGSCTNGRLEDLKIAAELLRGNTIYPEVRLIVIPGSQKVYLQAVQLGILEVFLKAGGVVTNPTCGPCFGGNLGILAEGEKVISTTNRNFTGRMGHPGSEVYLASPAVAIASAIKGRIASPEEVI